MRAKNRTEIANKKNRLENYEELRERVKRLQLTDDFFSDKVLADILACQDVIRIITKEDLTVKSVKTQYSIRNMENRSIIVDALAETNDGRLVNLEIHIQEDENHLRRVRYHQSSIDVSMLEKSKEFEEIPDLYLIFITMRDFLKGGKGIYVVERIARGTELVLDNGVHEFYVNLEVPAEDKDLRALQEYFKHSERSYESKSFPNLANRVNLLKEDKKGVDSMSGFAEELRAEGREEGRAEGKTEIVSMVRKKYHKNCTPAQAAEALELDEAYVEKVMKMITENPEATDYDIAFDLVCEKEDK